METVTGIFQSRQAAERAFSDLCASGQFTRENLLFLTPGAAAEKIDRIPTDEGEQPGMGAALGGVVGGAVGLVTGAILSNVVLPGVGPVLVLTLSAGSGVGGAALGAVGGSAAERALSNGLPRDELFFYEDALRRQHSLVVALADSDQAADDARVVLDRNGAESIDAARERWWIGVRDGEAANYGSDDFAAHESIYRAGFEAALKPSVRDKSLAAAEDDLRARYPELWGNATFRRGFERGRSYLNSFTKEQASEPNR
jgi:hypothetical protein